LKRAFVDVNGEIFSAGHIFVMLQGQGIASTGGSVFTLHQGVDALRKRIADESDEPVVTLEPARKVVAAGTVTEDDDENRGIKVNEEGDNAKYARRLLPPRS
jgi:hypothetical protein